MFAGSPDSTPSGVGKQPSVLGAQALGGGLAGSSPPPAALEVGAEAQLSRMKGPPVPSARILAVVCRDGH